MSKNGVNIQDAITQLAEETKKWSELIYSPDIKKIIKETEFEGIAEILNKTNDISGAVEKIADVTIAYANPHVLDNLQDKYVNEIISDKDNKINIDREKITTEYLTAITQNEKDDIAKKIIEVNKDKKDDRLIFLEKVVDQKKFRHNREDISR